MSEENLGSSFPTIEVDLVDQRLQSLEKMFKSFMETSSEDKKKTSLAIDRITEHFNNNEMGSKSESPSDSMRSYLPEKRLDDRRTSMFFGRTPHQYPEGEQQNNIQVLQADIVYEKDKELRVVSLEGLQYLHKQKQILSSRYPNREVRLAHMISFNLRPVILSAYNSYKYNASQLTGNDPEEVMIEDWLSLSNSTVSEILLEAVRPRTKEKYAREMILYLGKHIPQSPPVNAENFARTFYGPLIESLSSMLHLYDLLSHDSSNISNNASKMPVSGMGTRESPGHISLWLISLGQQKDAFIQFFGSDRLKKFKTAESAVVYIRAQLMDARSKSESRQDLDSKFTPIKYDDLRHTSGESHTRQQFVRTPQALPPKSGFPNRMPYHQKSTFAAIDLEDHEFIDQQNIADDTDFIPDHTLTDDHAYDEEDVDDEYQDNLDYSLHYPGQPENFLGSHPTLNVINGASTNAISTAFRGYCSHQFVFGECPKQHKGCLFDHSASGLEQCILSFTMLSKRELDRHSKLPPWTNNTPNVPMRKTPDRKYGIPDQQHGNKNSTPNYNFKHPERPYVTPNRPTTFAKSYTK